MHIGHRFNSGHLHHFIPQERYGLPCRLCYYFYIQYRINNQIAAEELRVIDENSQNLGILAREKAFAIAKERGLDIIEIAPNAKPPVARIISFDKFRYQREKEMRKQRQAQKAKELKHIRITPRAARNDLQIKATKTKEFLEEGHKVEINIFLRGREKANRAWAFQKLEEFLLMIPIPHKRTLEPRPGGRGFITQIEKK